MSIVSLDQLCLVEVPASTAQRRVGDDAIVGRLVDREQRRQLERRPTGGDELAAERGDLGVRDALTTASAMCWAHS